MKFNLLTQLKQTKKPITVLIIACITAVIPKISLAATATVSYGFGGSPATATSVVAPSQPGTTVATAPIIFKSVQTTTEIDSTRSTIENDSAVAQPVETAQGSPLAQSGGTTPKVGIGIDALFSDNLKVYSIPLTYFINRNFSLQANVPIVTAKLDDSSGANTGIGDLSLTVKHRIGSENITAALFTLVTIKFATGDADKSLGTGTYDVTLTEKIIKKIGGFRGTFMAGVTQPFNKPTILGSEVEYGTTISYMAALDHTAMLPDLWFGIRAEGMHSFESKIDRIAQGNALTTLDIAPELKYFFKKQASLNFGVNIPVFTEYALATSSNDRDIAVNFGISMLF